jgi:glycosyltransferase involved in cell wall biosynthesis
MDDVRLRITGGSTGDDVNYIRKIREKIKTAGLKDKVIFHEDFEGPGRQEFFSKVSLISVPVLEGEAFGLYLIEAMASGIPVVQPALGAFPEIVERSEGGIIYSPNKPENLATALAGLMRDREKLELLSEKGRKGIETHFNIRNQADRMIAIYRELLGD